MWKPLDIYISLDAKTVGTLYGDGSHTTVSLELGVGQRRLHK